LKPTTPVRFRFRRLLGRPKLFHHFFDNLATASLLHLPILQGVYSSLETPNTPQSFNFANRMIKVKKSQSRPGTSFSTDLVGAASNACTFLRMDERSTCGIRANAA
jgi:hypothetical protein